MKTERIICISFALIAVIMAMAMVYFFSCYAPQRECAKLFLIFWGIGLLLIVLGLLAIALLMLWQWGQITANQIEEEKKQAERQHSIECMSDLNKEAETRRKIERERNRINDLFRLIELAKEKPEEITDKSKTKEKGDVPKQIGNDITTKKNEIVNTDKLANLINQYQSLISNQQTKTT